MLSNTAKVIELYGEPVNAAFTKLLSRFERFEAITLSQKPMFKDMEHPIAVYEEDRIAKLMFRVWHPGKSSLVSRSGTRTN